MLLGKPDWRLLKEFLMKEGPLKKEQVTRILKDGINLMSKILIPNDLTIICLFSQGSQYCKSRRAYSHCRGPAWIIL